MGANSWCRDKLARENGDCDEKFVVNMLKLTFFRLVILLCHEKRVILRRQSIVD